MLIVGDEGGDLEYFDAFSSRESFLVMVTQIFKQCMLVRGGGEVEYFEALDQRPLICECVSLTFPILQFCYLHLREFFNRDPVLIRGGGTLDK